MVLRGFLKFLGGFLAVLVILGAVFGLIGYLALRNFDPNTFRSEFEKQLIQQTGFRVELGDIKLQWKPQPSLRIAGLKFFHPKTREELLQSDQIRIDADLSSIWKKYLTISQISVENPEISLTHLPGGSWNWEVVRGPLPPVPPSVARSSVRGLIPNAEASEGEMSQPVAGLGSLTEGWKFGIGKVVARNATVHFTDETVAPPYHLDVEKLELDVRQKGPASPFHFTANGTVFRAPKKNLEVEGDLDPVSQSLVFLLRYGPEKASFKGRLRMVRAEPFFEGTLEVRDLDVESVTPEAYKKGEYITGRLSAKSQLAFDGANPVAIERSLKGQGTIEIREGALRNRNLIKEVFDRMSPVLAITNALGGELPPELGALLKDRNTSFQSLQVAYGVEGGIVRVSEFRLVHSDYQLSGQGAYGLLDMQVAAAAQLLLFQAISAYLTKKIHEMALIADGNGQVTIPFRYSGIFPKASVQPDLGYLGSRLLQGGTEQLLNQGIQQLSKYLERKKKK